MKGILLGINLNTFTNRYTEPGEWTRVVRSVGVKDVQFNLDLLDPWYPWPLQKRICDETLAACRRQGVTIRASFGGHFHHQHYLGHPDRQVRAESEKWYARAIRQSAYLGAEGFGTCFAILSVRDNADSRRREGILKEAAEAYGRLARLARKEGLKYLLFESTSVERESCATIAETRKILRMCRGMDIPMKVCLDVGHVNPASPDPRDADYREWIREFATESPLIHIQQTDALSSRHQPFAREFNRKGHIRPKEVLAAFREGGGQDVLLALEFRCAAFHPEEERFLDYLRQSVSCWRAFVPAMC